MVDQSAEARAAHAIPTEQREKALLRLRRAPWGDALELLGVLLPALIVVALGLKYKDFVAHAIAANPVLNYTILGVLLVGALAMAWAALFGIEQRRAFVAWFDAQDELSKLQQWRRRYGFTLVGEAMRRMFDRTAGKDAERLLQAVEHEVAAVNAGIGHRHELGGYLVGGMVALGLLGTFIGLLETLSSISALVTGILSGLNDGGAIETAITTMVSQLRGPLNSMATAFSASMFGVTGSVVLGLMLVVVRRRSAALVEGFRDDAHDHARQLIVRHGLVDENKMTMGFLRQHLGAVAESLSRQTVHFEQTTQESVRTEVRISAALESMDRIASVYGDLANRMLAIDGMIVQLRELTGLTAQQVENGRQSRDAVTTLVGLVQGCQQETKGVSGELRALRDTLVSCAEQAEASLVAQGAETRAQAQAAAAGITTQLDRLGLDIIESAAPLNDIQAGMRIMENLLVQVNAEAAKREERSASNSAKLVNTMQVLRDTVATLAQSQEDDLRGVLVRLERHLVEIKGFGSGSEAVLRSLLQKAIESSSVLGRHTGLLEGVRQAMAARDPGASRSRFATLKEEVVLSDEVAAS